ncbi:uncharacterized protein SAPINGB_P001848 [Magnusiomyces paraingens]|uniref:Uncharacterized protein n=1 Tax=Magnusiomyces paraingens TaxID=2606893 RepID=A0A5E8BBW7_9ASCO|nr:uncharacterized protein SAPINGB_P001848 [Saprochaete ingens]VVT48579.1 unnamed protein product [Saprochaete ingens]
MQILLPESFNDTIEICRPFTVETCRTYLSSPESIDNPSVLLELAKEVISRNRLKPRYGSYAVNKRDHFNMFENDVLFLKFYRTMNMIYSSWDSISCDTLVIKELIGSIIDPNKTIENLSTEDMIENFIEYCFSEALFFNIKKELTKLEYLKVKVSMSGIFSFQLFRMLCEESSLKQVFLNLTERENPLTDFFMQLPHCLKLRDTSDYFLFDLALRRQFHRLPPYESNRYARDVYMYYSTDGFSDFEFNGWI